MSPKGNLEARSTCDLTNNHSTVRLLLQSLPRMRQRLFVGQNRPWCFFLVELRSSWILQLLPGPKNRLADAAEDDKERGG